MSTSVLKTLEVHLSFNLVDSSSCTLPWNLGAIVYGLYEIDNLGISVFSSSGLRIPASILMNVVFPVPF